jgi:hypothetical protein
MRKSIRLLTVIGVLGALPFGIVTHPASAAGLSGPIADCDHNGRLTRSYSIAQLHQALATIPADVAEYSPCYLVIQQALLARLAGQRLHGGSGDGGGSFLPTWLIAVLALALAGGGGFAALAWRRRAET